MAKIHRSARGQAVDMDMIRLSNETTIAIGNQKVNARGDQLGPGGKIVKSRAEIIQSRLAGYADPIVGAALASMVKRKPIRRVFKTDYTKRRCCWSSNRRKTKSNQYDIQSSWNQRF